jgi:predicted aspartyl protease
MPAKRATKNTVSAAGVTGATTGDGSLVHGGAVTHGSAPASGSTRKSTRSTARAQQKATSRQTGVKTSTATATDIEVSPASNLTTVVTPWDRENPGGSTQGSGERSEIRDIGSSEVERSDRVSGPSQVSVGVGDHGAAPQRLSVPAGSSALVTLADKTAIHVHSAASSANICESAVHPALTDVQTDYSVVTYAPVPQWPSAVAQPMTLPVAPRELGQPSIRNVEFVEPPLTSVYRPVLTNSADSGNRQSNVSRRRSRSASGYEPLPRTADYQSAYQPMDTSIRLPTFDGYGDLGLFLQRFEAVAGHCRWPPEEFLFRMKQQITGDAEYVLGDAIRLTSIQEFVDMLKVRFGSEAHAERYRAELARLRRGSMSLEQLHLRVHSLVGRAMPGPWSKATEIYARDAFLTALDDDDLRRRIMMACPPPETLSAVFDLAVRASAIDEAYPSYTRCRNVESQQRTEKYPKFSRVLSASDSADEGVVSRSEFQRVLDDQRKLLDELEVCRERLTKAESTLSARPEAVTTSETSASAPNRDLAGKRGQDQSRSVGYDTCRRCHQKGHWARECPLTITSFKRMPRTGDNSTTRARANVLTAAKRQHVQVYVQLAYEGQFYRALLDTGCDISVVGAHALPGLSYQECAQKLYAANESIVPIAGSTELHYKIGGVEMKYEVLVSEAIEEIIFGADWLSDHHCIWDFARGTLFIRDGEQPRPVSLHTVNRRQCIRRIFARETIEIPPRSQADVPVKSVWNTLPSMAVDWMVEPREYRVGVLLARTLLSPNGQQAYVRVLNCGTTPCTVPAGDLLTTAEAVEKQNVVEPTNQQNEEDEYEHVQCLIDDLPSCLTAEERWRASEFIRRYAHVFSKSATDLGRNRMMPHCIDTGDHPPIKQPMRRHPYAHLSEIERNVQELLASKVIEPATSPWASNVLLVKKKDGTWRFCVDYRKLNDLTRKEAYPLPRIDTCLESLGGSCYFSTLDLRAGYWQTELDPRDADKTAFITRSGQYRFTVLSMGLANAPSQFQRLMDLVLSGMLWDSCLVYLDDIIVYSVTFEQHLERLAAVFDRLSAANLKVKASKCQLFREEVHFLGHVISRSGIAADPEKVKVVASWPRPRDLHEVRSFLGLASYYRRFISGFADIACPLHQLTAKGQPFVWEAAQEKSFQDLKERLVSAPVLASPQDGDEYVLDTDASLSGLGAVLQQRQDGTIRVIAYASRTLSRAERNYSTTRRELLAVIFGFKQFRQFLLGRHFLLRVDHSALTYLRKTKDLMGQAARWLDYIEEYDFSIVHRSGSSHGNCDALSRRPSEESETTPKQTGISEAYCCRVQKPETIPPTPTTDLTSSTIAAMQAQDSAIEPLLTVIRNGGQRPAWGDIQSFPEETRILWTQFASLRFEDNILYRQYHRADGSVSHLQIVMPTSLRQTFLEQLHCSGGNVATTHLGVRKTQAHVQQRAYWPSWRTDTERFCHRCPVCQTVQHGAAPRHGNMRTYEANGAGDRLHIDLTGPHPVSRQGHVYIFTAIDAYTRYLVAVPLRNKSAVTVANALVEHVFLPHGAYRSIVSDQGREFCNEVLDEVTRLLGVEKLRTSAYRASANGRVERVHRTMNALLSKVVSENQRDWAERLPMVIAAYNAAHHETTEYSPYYLMFGREYRTPLDLTLNIPEEASPLDMGDYAAQLRERIQTAYEVVNQHLHTKTERMKTRYDAKVHTFQLQPGEFALYYCPRRKQGRYQKWRRLCTICKVENRKNDVLYSIRTSPRAKLILAHIDRLRRYESDVPNMWKCAPNVVNGSAQIVCREDAASNDSKIESPTTVPSNVEEGRDKPTLLTAEAAVAETGDNTGEIDTGAQQHVTHRPSAVDTGVQQDVTHRRFERGTGLESTQTGQIVRPQRVRRPPARYRQLHRDRSVGIQSEVATKVGVAVKANQNGQRSRATDGSRLHRRHRERGPWQCPQCDQPPIRDIATFRQHVVLQHNQYCSWSGHTRPFADDIEAERVRRIISKADRDCVKNCRVDNRHPC